MRGNLKRTTAILAIAICLVLCISVLTSCKAQFNTIGTSLNNLENGGVVTKQDKSIYYLNDGNIYKTSDITSKGTKIYDNDASCINVVGEKLYFYDNETSSICKCNSEGDRVEVIAEVYCEKFVVSRDNVIISILKSSGSKDLEAASNYDIVTCKVSDKKIANVSQKTLIKEAKLLGCKGDKIFFEKEVKDKVKVCSSDLDGKNIEELFEITDNAKVAVNSDGFVTLEENDGAYKVYRYTFEKSKKTELATVQAIEKSVLTATDKDVYVEQVTKKEDKVASDDIVKINIKDKKLTTVLKNENETGYLICNIGDKVYYAKSINNKKIDGWTELKESK